VLTESLKIPRTLAVVAECWEKAELELRRSIFEIHHNLNEETITILFHGFFRHQLRQASDSNRVSDAFLDDLRATFWDQPYRPELEAFASGLIAEVSPHNRIVEGKTGGDFGLTISRPWIIPQPYAFGTDQYECSMHQSGLLVQAKLRSHDGNWGRLTKRQMGAIEQRAHFLALLLYHYTDSNDTRKMLEPFRWQLCRASSPLEVKAWTRKSGHFPGHITSNELILSLGEGAMGTSDPELIQQIIQPQTRSDFRINIRWKDGEEPRRSLVLQTEDVTEGRVELIQYVSNR
jgi:hypothetical protein